MRWRIEISGDRLTGGVTVDDLPAVAVCTYLGNSQDVQILTGSDSGSRNHRDFNSVRKSADAFY